MEKTEQDLTGVPAIQITAKMDKGVLKLEQEIDLVDLVAEGAKRTDNTIDDRLVKLLELAKNNMDWVGYAKTIL